MSDLRHIWKAAYAAAFAGDFQRTEQLAGQYPTRGEAAFDTAMRVTSAERACDIADQAVREYARWNTEECGGESLDDRIARVTSEGDR